jgi:hypothetical protein
MNDTVIGDDIRTDHFRIVKVQAIIPCRDSDGGIIF